MYCVRVYVYVCVCVLYLSGYLSNSVCVKIDVYYININIVMSVLCPVLSYLHYIVVLLVPWLIVSCWSK